MLSQELVVDEDGNLRLLTPPNRRAENPFWHPKHIFLLCGIMVIMLCDIFVGVLIYGLNRYYLQYNSEALKFLWSFSGILLFALTSSLSLLLFVLYKVYEPNLELKKVVIEVGQK